MDTQIEKSYFDSLSEVLFEGDNKAADIKTMPGSSKDHTREESAKELLESLRRMGIVKNGTLNLS